MKKLSLLFIVCLTLGVCSADVLRPEQMRYVQSHRTITKKDLTTIPGKIIIYFQKGGKPDGVMTQDCFTVTSGINKNPLLIKYNTVTNLLVAVSNQLVVVKTRIEEIKAKNKSAIEDLDEIAKKYPLLKTLIDKIKAKIEIDFEAIEELKNKIN